MIGFYVIMIAVLAMSGAVGYTIFTSVKTTNALSLAERNAARLEMTVTALRQVVITDAEGRVFVPMGVASISGDPTSRTALPDWVSGEAITPWGADYAYCPYAPVAGTGGTSGTVYGGTDYSVNIIADPVIYGANRDYVVSGARPANGLDVGDAPDVLAFIISPSNNASATPSCANVYWDGRAWLTAGAVTGSVRALTMDGLADALSQAPRQLRRHVEQGATGSGLTADDPASLTRVIEERRYLRPHRLTVVLEDDGGDILLDPTTIDLGAGSGSARTSLNTFGRHMIFEAAPGASPTLAATTAGDLRVPFDLTVDGVDFGDDLGLSAMSGTRLLVTDATLSALDTGGGEVVLAGGVSVIAPVGAGSPPVRITGGSLAVSGATTIDAEESGGGAIRQNGGLLQVSASLTVNTAGSEPLFETGGYGPVSATPTATLDLNEAGPVSLSPYTHEAVKTVPCGLNELSCNAQCDDGRLAVSGTCSVSGAVNVFLDGAAISGSDFTCSWAQVSGAGTPSGPISSIATALCAPKR